MPTFLFLDRLRLILITTLLIGWSSASCTSLALPQPAAQGSQASIAMNTLAAQTWEALQTQNYLPATPTPLPTWTISEPTSSPVPTHFIIDTPIPTSARGPLPSITPLFPTLVFAPTPTPPTGTPGTPVAPCYLAKMIADATIPDGFSMPPNLPFTKVWRIKNVGSCTWDASYSFIFVSGDRMQGKSEPFTTPVPPGMTTDITINLISPKEPGNFRGNWMLQTNNIFFGSGSSGTQPFWVQIQVTGEKDPISYNFALNFCAARWETALGELPCPGAQGTNTGFVLYLDEPNLELRPENESTLWTNPQMVDQGWISGYYPAIEFKSGDHFAADVGCLGDFPNCNVTFELWYHLTTAPKQERISLGSWKETFNKKITHVDIDLSFLDGQSASLILIVRANSNPEQSAAFWLMPQIRHP